MKTIPIFCASQAAITTMDSNISSSSSSSKGGRAIDRHNPIIQDQKRLTTTINPTPPIPPNPNHLNNKNKSKIIKTNYNDQKRKTTDENHEEQLLVTIKNNQVVRRQGGGVQLLGSWGCTRPGDFISPANSSRFLLADKALSDQFDPLLKQVSPPPPPPPPLLVPEKAVLKLEHDKSFKNGDVDLLASPVKTPTPTSSSLSSRSSEQQVVVLKVSLHCRGCEKKMRKHISKMEGVTSFNIDFIAKKVTVVGDITPLAVLTSVSKVKNAKLLTPTTISTPLVDSNFSEIKKQLGVVA